MRKTIQDWQTSNKQQPKYKPLGYDYHNANKSAIRRYVNSSMQDIPEMVPVNRFILHILSVIAALVLIAIIILDITE